ncbi:MAG: hypothetical protein KJZ85_05540 [Rhodobacteraceae bacterium]|jgi:L-fucose isomerase-like protein|nr:hypothetical protein [Paracoccaceae bacterium]
MTGPLTGVLALGRPTFDLAYAGERLAAMRGAIAAAGVETVGPVELLLDAAAARAGLEALVTRGVDRILVLQVTFTDAAMIAEVAARFGGPLALWAPPEPRAGGRLRLNALCGLNLASHALGLRGRRFGWLFADPAEEGAPAAVRALLAGGRDVRPPVLPAPAAPAEGGGAAAARRLSGRRIGRIGVHPEGFDTCAYDAAAVQRMTGVAVVERTLPDLFARARAVPAAAVAAARQEAAAAVQGLEALDADELDRSLRLRAALAALAREQQIDAFAIRCWPEAFTEHGGAVCGPAAMLGEARTPCACEADVYGALTQLLLQEIAAAPVFLADLVDVDAGDDSAVVWHCGQAPLSLADPAVPARATVHSNRRMALLFEFALKPGRITLARISQAQGRPRMVIAGAEMLRRPMAFTGTSGVLRFDAPAGRVLAGVIDGGLEHHMALAYGDHRAALAEAAAALGLPVQDLCAD